MAQVMLNQVGCHLRVAVPDRFDNFCVFVGATLVAHGRRMGCQCKRAKQDQPFEDLSQHLVAQRLADEDVKPARQPDLLSTRPSPFRIVLPFDMRKQCVGRGMARLFTPTDQLGDKLTLNENARLKDFPGLPKRRPCDMCATIGLVPDTMRLTEREKDTPDTAPADTELFREIGFDQTYAGWEPTLCDCTDEVIEDLPLLLGKTTHYPNAPAYLCFFAKPRAINREDEALRRGLDHSQYCLRSCALFDKGNECAAQYTARICKRFKNGKMVHVWHRQQARRITLGHKNGVKILALPANFRALRGAESDGHGLRRAVGKMQRRICTRLCVIHADGVVQGRKPNRIEIVGAADQKRACHFLHVKCQGQQVRTGRHTQHDHSWTAPRRDSMCRDCADKVPHLLRHAGHCDGRREAVLADRDRDALTQSTFGDKGLSFLVIPLPIAAMHVEHRRQVRSVTFENVEATSGAGIVIGQVAGTVPAGIKSGTAGFPIGHIILPARYHGAIVVGFRQGFPIHTAIRFHLTLAPSNSHIVNIIDNNMVTNMARNQDAFEIPIIDIGGFLHGSETQKQQTAELVDRTNREVGFLLITGHGIDRAAIDGMFEVSRGFFEGPSDFKLAVKAPIGEQQGYHGLGQSGLAAKEGKKAPPDIREYFMTGRLDMDDPYFRQGDAMNFYRPNRWPVGQDAFRKHTEAYYSEMERLSGKLMQLFGLALGVGEEFFTDKIDRHFAILSSIYYPAQDVPPQPGQLRAGAHTDYGALTILAPSNSPGGLEVLDRQGNWRAVPYIPDAFVINIGDMMQRWTNERWTSNMHRVVNPPDSDCQTGPRQSLAFFLHPNFDTLVEAIPGTVPHGATPIHSPILAGQYMREKEEEIASGQPKAKTA